MAEIETLNNGTTWLSIILWGFVLLWVGCDPFNTAIDDSETPQYYRANTLTTPEPGDDLLVMNWNIKYAGGRIDFWFDCWGERVVMERHEVLKNLEGLVTKIRHVDADILMVQEIDIDSKRGAYIDQVQWVLDHTDYNYAVYSSQWRADFIPSDGLGKMDMGNAIFSKYPLEEARRIGMPQSPTQAGHEAYFYLRRNILAASLQVPDFGAVEMVTFHVDAYSQDGTKKVHIDMVKDELDRLDDEGITFVAGGDLNTLPPGSQEQHIFEDAVCEQEEFSADDYRDEQDWLASFYEDYEPAIALSDYQENNDPYFSHSTHESVFWNRKLDYIFSNGSFAAGSALTHQDQSSGGIDTMALSDHAPLSVRFELEAP